jgi:hypothetical protein
VPVREQELVLVPVQELVQFLAWAQVPVLAWAQVLVWAQVPGQHPESLW